MCVVGKEEELNIRDVTTKTRRPKISRLSREKFTGQSHYYSAMDSMYLDNLDECVNDERKIVSLFVYY